MTTTKLVSALAAGILFGLGLAASGMINPAKVLGFLDMFGGQWNPNLAGVMGGAIPVAALFFYLARKLKPATDLPAPPVTRIDRKLILGATLFGVGWGLAGICPGPGLIAVFFDWHFLPFMAALLIGLALGTRINSYSTTHRPAPDKG